MRNFTIEEINDRFNSLSPELQSIITSPAIKEGLEQIAQKNGLKLDELGVMVDLVGLIILGLLSPTEFIEEFSSETGVTEKSARILVGDINTQLFSKIKTSMREFEEKSRESNTPQYTQPQNRYQNPNPTTIASPAKDSSPHADLEQAGNFKIETEASFDGNYTMKAPPKKNPFAQEQKAQWTNANPADMAMFTQNPPAPAQTQPSQPISQSDPQPQQTTPPKTDTGTASKMQAFDPKNFYNFGNIEEQVGDKKENKDDDREGVTEEKKVEDKPEAPVEPKAENQIFQKSASAIHFEKESKNKHSRFTASQVYQPKVKEISPEPSFDSKQNQNQTVENEEQSETEKENTALIDELMAHPKAVIPEKSEKIVSPPQNLPTENLPSENITTENAPTEKQTEKSADGQVDNKFVSAFEPTPVSITPEPIPVPSEPELPKIQPEIQPTQTPTEEKPTPVAVEPVPIPIPISKEPEATTIPPEPQTNPTEPSIEEIRNDIRSKVSEYNPKTTWPTTPIQAPSEIPATKPEPTVELNEISPDQKSDTGVINLIPIKKAQNPDQQNPAPQAPVKSRGFDPYREPIQ